MAVDLTGDEAKILAGLLYSVRENCDNELQGKEIPPGSGNKMPTPDANRAAYLAEVIHVCNKVLANMLNNPAEPQPGLIPPKQ